MGDGWSPACTHLDFIQNLNKLLQGWELNQRPSCNETVSLPMSQQYYIQYCISTILQISLWCWSGCFSFLCWNFPAVLQLLKSELSAGSFLFIEGKKPLSGQELFPTYRIVKKRHGCGKKCSCTEAGVFHHQCGKNTTQGCTEKDFLQCRAKDISLAFGRRCKRLTSHLYSIF